jgi:hypothetical protein
MRGSIHPIPHTPPWRSAQLSTDILPLSRITEARLLDSPTNPRTEQAAKHKTVLALINLVVIV